MTAPGSSLESAIVGTSDFAAALAFYRDVIGMVEVERTPCRGPAFARHWRLPEGAVGEAVLLRAVDCPVGQVRLIKFGDGKGPHIRQGRERSFIGHFNLNFYVKEIIAAARRLSKTGVKLWSIPTRPDVAGPQGRTIEALFDGPDGVVINLVELYGGDISTVIGKLRADVDAFGRTPTGFTPVATFTHVVADADPAIAFYRDALGMQAVMDFEIAVPEANRMMGRPEDGKTRIVLFTGNHMFGKIVVSHPLNYSLPRLVERAVPPASGLLAQSFAVPDLDNALATSGARIFSPPIEVEVPGRGVARAAVVHAPGSGALIELVQA